MSAFNNKNKNNAATVAMAMKWNNSIFIPMIHFNITKNQLKDIMEQTLGKVSRIDFAAFNSDNGTGRRAFVHFSQWYKTDYATTVRSNIEHNGHYDISIPNQSTYYTTRLLINKNPVPETEQTIQQVASNMDFMAEKIRLQEEEIQGLKQLCENLFFNMKTMEKQINILTQCQYQNMGDIAIIEDDVMGEMHVSELN